MDLSIPPHLSSLPRPTPIDRISPPCLALLPSCMPLPVTLASPLSLPATVTSSSLEGKGRLLASNLIPFLRREKVGGAGRVECQDQLLRLSFMNNTISQDIASRRNVTTQAGNGSSLRTSLNVHNSCKMRGVLHIQHARMLERQNSHHFISYVHSLP